MLEKEKMETAGKKQEIDCLRIEICSLKEDLDIQEQLHLQVKKKKSYYKSPPLAACLGIGHTISK